MVTDVVMPRLGGPQCVAALDAPATAFLSKPYVADDLVAAVEWLSAPSARES